MIEKTERQNDILKVIESLDITPSMYKNADDKYHALADYLSHHTDFNIEVYPQGSFAFGTVVRPLKGKGDASYDLDDICEVSREKGDITAEELKTHIEEAISNGELYGGKLEITGQCLTVCYADEGGASFSIDVVPAAHENSITIERLKQKSSRPDLIDTAIAIPMSDEDKYVWKTNNPKGFTKWFREINNPYKECSRSDFRKNLFERTDFYDCVEDIPEGMERSSVQRVIQILKRHRDLYYDVVNKPKPISAIINVLVTDIASSLDPTTDTFTLLEYVLNELSESSKYYEDRNRGEILLENTIIARKNRKWYIANPANPEDNLADAWNKSDNIAKTFFEWISVAKDDFIYSMDKPDYEFMATAANALGQDIIEKTWKDKYDTHIPTSIPVTSKPWRY